MSRLFARIRAVFIGGAMLTLLAACASGSAASIPGAEECIPVLATAALEPVEHPNTFTGPSTACTSTSTIHSPRSSPRPQLPTTISDAQGTEVTIESAERILALDVSGTLASTVFALGLGDNVVGRDTSTGFPEAAGLPLVTQNGHQLNAEAILALDPTVILTDSSIGPWDVVIQMRQAGIPVVVMSSQRSITTVGSLIADVAASLGVPDAGAHLAAEAEAAIDETTQRIAEIVPEDRLRMMFLYVRGSANVYYLFGAESGADALIRALGGVDVAAEVGIQGMRPLTAEAIVTAAPDLVLVMTKGLESVGGVDGLLDAVPALAQTPAGANRRIVDMSDHEILSFGPDYALVIDALGRAIYAPRSSGG